MNWTRLILDALVMAAVFNLAAMAAMAYDPRLSCPAIPKASGRSRRRRHGKSAFTIKG